MSAFHRSLAVLFFISIAIACVPAGWGGTRKRLTRHRQRWPPNGALMGSRRHRTEPGV